MLVQSSHLENGSLGKLFYFLSSFRGISDVLIQTNNLTCMFKNNPNRTSSRTTTITNNLTVCFTLSSPEFVKIWTTYKCINQIFKVIYIFLLFPVSLRTGPSVYRPSGGLSFTELHLTFDIWLFPIKVRSNPIPF